ncbi:hypothetical protein AGDE_13082 [Angomonas deanei]|uniref:EF-hand domain-containing protein n=1 Tax=Angomonas deanei TaxID=59799 RepID=A0A7G2CGE5_9TRYP|nr:hypothetical protein AGDE_13082 [Angomonas deanei]CAD2218579.1 hypothetical protein, conserved [Angomonas deanei]|eukprot:EPY22760.1 hypothetical protein AGDE_13082 [Angomonas deanei]
MEEYMDILKKFNEWNSEGNTASVATQRGDSEENAKPAAPTGKEPLLSPRPSPQRQLQLPLAPRSSTKSPSSCRGSSTGRRLEAAVEDSLQRPLNDGTALEEALFVNSVAPPRPTLSLFLMAPRNMFNTSAVDISVIFENFGLKVSLVKSEAELLMYDSNNDGRVAEDEMEEYVRDLVPRIDALRDLPEELVPFYCCTASRRVFWDPRPLQPWDGAYRQLAAE